jgi:hypothetical protein
MNIDHDALICRSRTLQRVQPPSFLQDIEANPIIHPLHRQEERIDPIIEQYVREEAA